MTGIELIAQERRRQIEREEFDSEYDAAYNYCGELAYAAAVYASPEPIYTIREHKGLDDNLPFFHLTNPWPWEEEDYKPKDEISNLVRAGALIVAEIDRLIAEKNPDSR